MEIGFCVICASSMTLKDPQQLTCSSTHSNTLRERRRRIEAGEIAKPFHCRSCGQVSTLKDGLTRPCARCTFIAPRKISPVAKTCQWCGNLNPTKSPYCSPRCADMDAVQKANITPPSPAAYAQASSIVPDFPSQPLGSAAAPAPTRSFAPRTNRFVALHKPPNGTCLFCGKELEAGSPSEKKYCSSSHAKAAQRKRKAALARKEEKLRETFDPNLIGRCAFPEKMAYPSKEEAMEVIERTQRWTLVPYLCNCMMWHLGNNRYGSKANYDSGYTSNTIRKQSERLSDVSMERMRKTFRGPRKRY